MEAIKFILVILLCIPMAFLLVFFLSSLINSVRKQQDKAERVRQNKAMFQNNSASDYESNYTENKRGITGKRKRGIQLNFGKNKRRRRIGGRGRRT